jgi:O-antigen ligase
VSNPVGPSSGLFAKGRGQSATLLWSGIWAVTLAALLVAALLISGRARQAASAMPGTPPARPRAVSPLYGVNADLRELCAVGECAPALEAMQAAGLRWLRQPFPWAEIEPQRGEYRWQASDALVEAARSRGISIIALLDTAPPWSHPAKSSPRTPPDEVADFGRWVRALAERYGAEIEAYQVWSEPNLSDHWGAGFVDPAAYVVLLREAYIQVKAADPTATVLSAELAPTLEEGPLNLNEMAFLEGVYSAGGGDFFDALGANALGWWSGPEDRRAESGVLNFSRLALLRRVMVARGDEGKAVWATSFGWNALPPDWSGPPSPWGTDDEELQADRTARAIRQARDEWPWLGPLLLAEWGTGLAPDDPRRGFALLEPGGEPRLLYRRIAEVAAAPPVATVGSYAADSPTGRYEGGWRLSPLGADVGHGPARLQIPFRGNRFDLEVRRGPYKAFLYVAVDGQPSAALPGDEAGRSYVVLYDPLAQAATVTLARNLADGDHLLEITPEGGWGQWAIVGWRVGREPDLAPYWYALALISLVALVPLFGLYRTAPGLPWSTWYGKARAFLGRRGDTPYIILALIAVALLYPAPGPVLPLVGLAYLAALILARPDFGFALVAFALPFFLHPLMVLGRELSPVELATLLTALAVLLHWRRGSERAGLTLRLTGLDWAAIFFVATGGLSLLAAENPGVAVRELRVVVVEPVLFYALLRATPLLPRQRLWRVVDAFVLGAVVVSCLALYQYLFTSEVIVAEGVRRARALYASPNNLSLFLDRALPVLLAVSLFAGDRRRRVAYALGMLPVAAALYLTFSKGAWLLGLPAALLFVGLLRGRRWLWAMAGAVVAELLALLPVLGTSRLRSLLDTGSGSTFFRLNLWQSAWAMVRDHPLFGVGLDNFLYQYRTRYILPDAWAEPDLSHPHNVILDYWTRLGLGGVVALFWLQVAFWRRSLRLYHRLPDGDGRALLLGLMAAMVAALAHGLIDNSYFLVDLAFVFFMTLGLVAQLEEGS